MDIHELMRKAKDAPDYFPRRKISEEAAIMIETFGADDQLNVAMEECAELIQAISKARRYGIEKPSIYYNLAEEIGDVTIIIEYLKQIYNISQEDINKCIHVKLKRANEIIKKYENNNTPVGSQ